MKACYCGINRSRLYFWNGKYCMRCWFSATISRPPRLLVVLTVQVSPCDINHAGKSIELLGFMWV